ncbi:MAG: aldolase/citrate lyase family protein, partial [Planctomycetia bacterium]
MTQFAPDPTTPNHPLELYLFTADVELARVAEKAGVDGVIVDWENVGKETRQKGYDLQLNRDTPAEVRRLADAVGFPVTVRINRLSGGTAQEVQTALDHGARRLMLPMAESAGEVERFLRIVAGRAETIIQVENQTMAAAVGDLRDLEWTSVYIGLNDLMVSRGGVDLWEAVLDGTVERLFTALAGRRVGFAGVTVVGGGRPIPFVNIFSEMARVGCRLSVLRRSFLREVQGRDFDEEIA